MELVKISYLLSDVMSGEWGKECSSGDNSAHIIRTTNFLNSGLISFDKIIKREIAPKIALKKQLRDGDIIIERSGGSPNQPVGRVVYFEKPNDEIYLCNNFTSILRPDRNKVLPKYLFYLLYNNYHNNRILSFQNNTTGIINLQLERYLDSNILYDSEIENQNKIVAILDKAKLILNKREETVHKYDELFRAIFLSMFGNPMERPNKWTTDSINKCLIGIKAGRSYAGENKKELEEDELGVLKVSAVTKGVFNPKEYKAVKKSSILSSVIYPQKGDLLFSRANTLELVGATCIVGEDYKNLFLPDKIWKIDIDETIIKKVFLHYVLQNKDVKKTFLSIATGSTGSMLNISMEKFKSIIIPYPPIDLQNKFESCYLKYVEIKKKLEHSTLYLNKLINSISQLAFRGELEFGSGVELEVLLENDYQFFKNNSSKKTIQLLLDRMDKSELNMDKFYDPVIYENAKNFIFNLLKEGEIEQLFDNKTNSIKIKIK